MAFLEVFITIVFNLLPVGLIWIPILFIRKRPIFKKIYTRLVLGISLFFVVYFIMPVIFQIGDPLTLVINTENDVTRGVAYLFARLFNVVANFFQIPLINQAFIFLLAPFIAIIYLFFRLKKEDKSKFKIQLTQLTFEYNKSPKEIIIENLTKGNLREEMRLFRSLIVLLPITLYLLVTVLKIAGVAALDPADGGLGWFIEIFFIYIATFLYAIQLIKASKASFQGKFVGEKLENDTYSSMMTVATPISILSILLFIVEAFQGSASIGEAFQSLSLVLYFFAYYIMAAFIFVSTVAIFEPIAILILIKIINGIKHKEEIKTPTRPNTANFGQSAMFGLVSILAIFIFAFFLSFVQGMITIRAPQDIIASNLFEASPPPQFLTVLLLEGLSAVQALGVLVVIVGVGMIVGISYSRNKKLLINSVIILAFLVVEAVVFQLLAGMLGGNIFPFFGDPNSTYWITSKIVRTDAFGFWIMPRTALVETSLLESNMILYALSIPFQYTHYFFAFIFVGLTFHYVQQNFITKTVKRDKFVDHITFAKINYLPTYEECQQSNYLLSIPKTYRPSEGERDEVKHLMYECRNGKTITDLLPDDVGEKDRMYVTLKYMTSRKNLVWWEPEFSFTNERAELDSMYTMYEDGRDVFSYKFKESSTADPGLVAGMFSAITSFIKETTKSADLLRTIDHGDTKVIIEYGEYVFGAIFADRETTEIRSKLKTFVTEFEKRHTNVLKKWDGNCTPFANDDLLLKEIFEI
ncbi:MAG: hypothetical protein JW776_15175 [Candidatus Lokiarchaeota archaeon]|nr:hypothetical protein [Candidatus Lokiarchaeota archaeon]